MGKRTVIGIGIVVALLGAVGAFNAARSLGQAPVEKRDVTTQGTVTQLSHREFKNRRGQVVDITYSLEFSFEAEDGKSYTGREQIKASQFKSFSKGQPIDVIYKSHNPKSNAAVGYGAYISVDAMPNTPPEKRLWICLGTLIFGVVVICSTPFLTEDPKPSTKVATRTAQLEASYQSEATSLEPELGSFGLSSAQYLQSTDWTQQTPSEPTPPTLPTHTPEELENIHPTDYVHQECGTVTVMPAHIRATYLVDPCYYSSGTICANCGEVPDSQCTWVETGENLATYMKRLKSAKSQEYHLARFLIPIGCGMLLALVCAINAISDGRPVELGQAFGSVIGGALLAFYPSKFIRLAMCKFGWI